MIVKLLTISKLKRRLQRLVPVCTCENVKLLEMAAFMVLCLFLELLVLYWFVFVATRVIFIYFVDANSSP